MRRINLSFGLAHLLILLLVATNIITLLLWQPWQGVSANTRKITISGSGTIKAVPDEYQFSPYYQVKDTSAAAALEAKILAQLKKLGVEEKSIKTNASNYTQPEVDSLKPETKNSTTTLSLTITIADRALAQKVLDYLVTTDPEGSITPYAVFSDAKSKSLEAEARVKAIEDARSKADATAQGLGVKIGKVIEVNEQSGKGIYPIPLGGTEARDDGASPSLTIQPGEDEFTYTVEVVFALK